MTTYIWCALVGIYAVPLALIGIIRFLTIKETNDVDVKAAGEKINMHDAFTVLKKNPYIYIIAIASLVSSLITSMGINIYYFTHIVHNVAAMVPLSMVLTLLIVDCAEYNEWKDMPRMLYTFIPLALIVIVIITMGFYTLDKKMPQIRRENEEACRAVTESGFCLQNCPIFQFAAGDTPCISCGLPCQRGSGRGGGFMPVYGISTMMTSGPICLISLRQITYSSSQENKVFHLGPAGTMSLQMHPLH